MSVVVEVTVFTLDELKAKGGKPYQKALENVKTSDTSGDWCTWLSQDMNDWFKDGPGKFEDGESPFDGGKIINWDAEHRTANFTYEVDLFKYIERNKLYAKMRALHRFAHQTYRSIGWTYTIGGKAGSDYSNRFNDPYSPADHASGLCEDIDQLERENPERAKRINAELDELMNHIGGDCERVKDKLRQWAYNEWMYRYSDEFAKDEAEAHDMKFLEDGRIFSINGFIQA